MIQTLAVYYCNPDIAINKTADVAILLEGDTANFAITRKLWD